MTNFLMPERRKAPSPDDPLLPFKTEIGGKTFWYPVSRLGRLPEMAAHSGEAIARRLAAGWNVLIGLSDAELADLKPGDFKRLREENARLTASQTKKEL